MASRSLVFKKSYAQVASSKSSSTASYEASRETEESLTRSRAMSLGMRSPEPESIVRRMIQRLETAPIVPRKPTYVASPPSSKGQTDSGRSTSSKEAAYSKSPTSLKEAADSESPTSPKEATCSGSPTSLKEAADSRSQASPKGNANTGGSSPTSPTSNMWKVAPEWSHVYTIMPVMTTSATSIEDQLDSITKALEGMTTLLQNQEKRINDLAEKVDCTRDGKTSKALGKQPEIQGEDASHSPTRIGRTTIHEESTSDMSIPVTGGMIPVDRLNEFIMGAIKGKLEGGQPSYTYSKPYTQRIEDLKMPVGYQPPTFQQFDGKGNPRQHIAHFVETCNDAGTYGDLLVKQFVRSLKGTAFNWYTDLESGCIDSWHDMEREFLTRFYSTRRTVSFLELTTTRQRKGECSTAYIERWRESCLNCKEKISQSSAIEMCIKACTSSFLTSSKDSSLKPSRNYLVAPMIWS
ncbi:uncharacterized protein LOC116019514 [Ipomoea triloba]|uniref:uncharacterized protein LOC116019514 n=1 Tax=Ipomoea triloba TaxID=35885 RepID=UPI00125D1269|nr:uncharacterized protein LOC116019514 [Ipomoea triloba]